MSFNPVQSFNHCWRYKNGFLWNYIIDIKSLMTDSNKPCSQHHIGLSHFTVYTHRWFFLPLMHSLLIYLRTLVVLYFFLLLPVRFCTYIVSYYRIKNFKNPSLFTLPSISVLLSFYLNFNLVQHIMLFCITFSVTSQPYAQFL